MGLRATLPNHIPACRSEFFMHQARILESVADYSQCSSFGTYADIFNYGQLILKIMLPCCEGKGKKFTSSLENVIKTGGENVLF